MFMRPGAQCGFLIGMKPYHHSQKNFGMYYFIILPVISQLEKARAFDPFGHAGLTPLGEIRMTPVEASAGEFFCSFEIPCPGTAGINLKNYRI